jgi:hypothetical protein
MLAVFGSINGTLDMAHAVKLGRLNPADLDNKLGTKQVSSHWHPSSVFFLTSCTDRCHAYGCRV